MVFFPNAKINLGLRILRKRADGFHDLETIFYPLPFFDAAEILITGTTNIEFTSSGLPIDTNSANNLCAKAYTLLKKDFPAIGGIKFHLHKAIPAGAGLGGGSADAAFTLKALNAVFKLQITDERLRDYALTLGSDCPFFLVNKPCFATGRGENLTPVNLSLAKYEIVIVNPGIHVSTRDAFSMIRPSAAASGIREIIAQPIETWKLMLQNDFEKPVFKLYPAIENIKTILYDAGAVFAAMSGSGSTVFGLFDRTPPPFHFPENYFVKILRS